MKIRYLIIFLLSAVIMASCSIKDDLSDCPKSGRYIRVHFTVGESYTYSKAIADEDLNDINLYIFDESGYFVAIEDAVQIDEDDYYMDIDLEPGLYTFIVWANIIDCSILSHEELIPGETTLNELLFEIESDDDNVLPDIPSSLYYGFYELAEITEVDDHDFYIDLTSQLYTINLWTRGLENFNDDFRYIITDKHGKIGFNNMVESDDDIYYVSTCERDSDGQLFCTLKILHLQENRQNAYLTLMNVDRSEIFFSANLVELILSLRDYGVTVDFNRIYEYNIVLVFGADMEVTVYINGWKVREQEGNISV